MFDIDDPPKNPIIFCFALRANRYRKSDGKTIKSVKILITITTINLKIRGTMSRALFNGELLVSFPCSFFVASSLLDESSVGMAMSMCVCWSRGRIEGVVEALFRFSKDDTCDRIIPIRLLCFVDAENVEGNVIGPREDRKENDRAWSHHAKARIR